MTTHPRTAAPGSNRSIPEWSPATISTVRRLAREYWTAEDIIEHLNLNMSTTAFRNRASRMYGITVSGKNRRRREAANAR